MNILEEFDALERAWQEAAAVVAKDHDSALYPSADDALRAAAQALRDAYVRHGEKLLAVARAAREYRSAQRMDGVAFTGLSITDSRADLVDEHLFQITQPR